MLFYNIWLTYFNSFLLFIQNTSWINNYATFLVVIIPICFLITIKNWLL